MRVLIRSLQAGLWAIVVPMLMLLLGERSSLALALGRDPSLYTELWAVTLLPLLLFGAWVGRREAKLEAEKAELDELAVTDPLTGLKNVRYFQARLAEAWARNRRDGSPVGLAVIDLDRFKAVNDDYGHAVGDKVLEATACAIQAVCRRDETAARIGGEEFAVILPGADAETARAVGERIRQAIAARTVKVKGHKPLSVTASVGVASTRGGSVDSAEALYTAADRALYSSKQSGRDRTSIATPPPPSSASFASVTPSSGNLRPSLRP